MDLTHYRTLGRSGLVVSPLCLGTMTFGAQRWGSDDAGSATVFDAYADAGGNFVDTADVYSGGHSEETVGHLIAERGLRDRIVLATKAGFNGDRGNPNGGGNGRKNIHRALDGSLRRLGTDWVDLYWVHVWDTVTPAEELLDTLAGLVRSGKIRYYGLSNVPAWYAARLATLAEASGAPRPVALQLEYSLVARSIESEFVPAARALGMGVVPWSPLAGGFLSGKYSKGETDDAGRLSGPNPFGDTKFTDANWRVLDVLREVADEAGCTPAQAALAWALARPGVDSVVIGASRADQVEANVAALGVALTPEQTARLDAASARSGEYTMDGILSPAVNRGVFGGHTVTGWQ